MEQFKRAQVILLQTKNRNTPLIQGNISKKFYHDPDAVRNGNLLLSYQHLYIISDDEIKEGDWYIRIFDNTLMKASSQSDHKHYDCKKIIATTYSSLGKNVHFIDKANNKANQRFDNLPQPSQQFIEKYIEEYNRGSVITDVLVEYKDDIICESIYGIFGNIIRYENTNKGLKLKVNPKDNTITIKKLKDSWNREEVISLLTSAFWYNNENMPKVRINEWIKENL